MSTLSFTKMQSIGNDFVLIALDAFAGDAELVAFVRRACERRFGVGSDGLLALGPTDRPGRLKLRMFNPDGTEDFCGNGLRCAAHYAITEGWVRAPFVIDHWGRDVRVEAQGDIISTELGLADYDPPSVPLAPGAREHFEVPLQVGTESLTVSALSTGSTHTVVFVDELPGDDRFFRLSPLIEHHPLFPEKTSVIWTRVESPGKLKLRIWERSVGETLGCGSGSTAAAAAYLRREGRTGAVEVVNPGGEVTVTMDRPDGPLTISGRAQIVFRGEWPTCLSKPD
jgi:diaminopimelate epimerase